MNVLSFWLLVSYKVDKLIEALLVFEKSIMSQKPTELIKGVKSTLPILTSTLRTKLVQEKQSERKRGSQPEWTDLLKEITEELR